MAEHNDSINVVNLIKEAYKAREKSYSPYSSFRVGAALLCADNSIVYGCNIENSSYSATNCAERTAIYSAIACGKREFKAIAIVGGYEDEPDGLCYPCGICRQVMAEFCDKDLFKIIVASNTEKYRIYSLTELLPEGFSL